MSEFKPGQPVVFEGKTCLVSHTSDDCGSGDTYIVNQRWGWVWAKDLRPATPEEVAAAGMWVDPRVEELERQNAALHAVAAWVLDLTGHAPCCATNQGPYPCDCGFVEAQKLIDACRSRTES